MMIWGMVALGGMLIAGYCSVYNRGWNEGQVQLKTEIETAVDEQDAAAEAVYQDELEDGESVVDEIEAADEETAVIEGVLELYDR